MACKRQRESARPTMPHSRLTSASRCGGAVATSDSPARSQPFTAAAGTTSYTTTGSPRHASLYRGFAGGYRRRTLGRRPRQGRPPTPRETRRRAARPPARGKRQRSGPAPPRWNTRERRARTRGRHDHLNSGFQDLGMCSGSQLGKSDYSPCITGRVTPESAPYHTANSTILNNTDSI